MLLQDILKLKGTTVHSIGPDQTLREAVRELVERRVGALVVCQPNDAGGVRLLGMFSERDLLHLHAEAAGGAREVNAAAAAAQGGACRWMDTKVVDVMTVDVITGSPGDTVEQIMGLMTNKRIRHLPVVSEGRLVGIVSIGDLVKAQLDDLATENRFMKDYIRR